MNAFPKRIQIQESMLKLPEFLREKMIKTFCFPIQSGLKKAIFHIEINSVTFLIKLLETGQSLINLIKNNGKTLNKIFFSSKKLY